MSPAHDESLIGVADIAVFERNETEEEKGMSGAETSYQWPERAIEAKNRLEARQEVIAVQDREGDI